MIKCKDCGIEFKTKNKKIGFANQCDECSIDDIPKYLGFNDGSLNKSTNTAIYRGTDESVRKKIANQKARVG